MTYILTLVVFLFGWAASALAQPAAEPPSLAAQVAAGTLPPMAERLPEVPLVVDPAVTGGVAGRYGGTLRTLVDRPQDVRLMVVWGYARLVGFNATRDLIVDIAEKVDVKERRIFTIHLRPGHRWSDGHPFTAEDFRFYWEDVLHNAELSPKGLPGFLIVEGNAPTFEVVNETTVRYTWPTPNPTFLTALAGPRPEELFLPAHYLKQFLPKYTEPEALAAAVKAAGAKDWQTLFHDSARTYRNTNPDLPSLQPWVRDGAEKDGTFRFKRNPYFHRVDPEGRQLPYIDSVAMTVVDAEKIPERTAAGDSDLQARGLGFDQFPMLKVAEAQKRIDVKLWVTAKGSEVALYPNYNVSDVVWRDLLYEPDFRRALSLAIDRDAINLRVFEGLGVTANNSVMRESPLYDPDFAEAWATYAPHASEARLDDLGLERGADGMRKLPDGRPLVIPVAVTEENPTDITVLNMIAETWKEIGVGMRIDVMPRRTLRDRAMSGEIVMSAWKGLENAIPVPELAPSELAPTQSVQLQWPQWGAYVQTQGRVGVPIGLPAVARLSFLREAWMSAATRLEQRAAWLAMLASHAENVFSIGTVQAVPQPVVTAPNLRNVPDSGVYTWELGAYFGVYQPDIFWFEEQDR